MHPLTISVRKLKNGSRDPKSEEVKSLQLPLVPEVWGPVI